MPDAVPASPNPLAARARAFATEIEAAHAYGTTEGTGIVVAAPVALNLVGLLRAMAGQLDDLPGAHAAIVDLWGWVVELDRVETVSDPDEHLPITAYLGSEAAQTAARRALDAAGVAG